MSVILKRRDVEVSFDSPTHFQDRDSVNGEPRFTGFNCVSPDHVFLTLFQPTGCMPGDQMTPAPLGQSDFTVEQVGLTREELIWLRAEGIPRLLAEMDAAERG